MLVNGFIAGRDGMPVAITLEAGANDMGYLMACRDLSRPNNQAIPMADVFETEHACVVATMRAWAVQAGEALGSLSFVVVGSAAHTVFGERCRAIVELMRRALVAGIISIEDVRAAIEPTSHGRRVLEWVATPQA